MQDRNNPYHRQVELVVRVLPLIWHEPNFALKGGTAINLFMQELPRLSVDIDLVFLPITPRDEALKAIDNGLKIISENIEQTLHGAKARLLSGNEDYYQKLQVSLNGVQIKIEVSPVMRGTILPINEMGIGDRIEEAVGYVEARVLDRNEVYAGKLVAALDRQHPRDLFDVKILREGEGITDALMDLFVLYLVSSNRPIAELLAPNYIPLQLVFDRQFSGMTMMPVTVSELENTREWLLAEIKNHLTDPQKEFLISFKSASPNWELLTYRQAENLPAVQWKLRNIRSMDNKQREKALEKLRSILF